MIDLSCDYVLVLINIQSMPPKKSKREKSRKQKDEAKDVLGKKLRGKKEIWSGQTLEQRELMKMLGKYCK